MITKEIREIIERGIKAEEQSKDGKVLHDFPAYETKIYWETYKELIDTGLNTDFQDKVLEAMANEWKEYFKVHESSEQSRELIVEEAVISI